MPGKFARILCLINKRNIKNINKKHNDIIVKCQLSSLTLSNVSILQFND